MSLRRLSPTSSSTSPPRTNCGGGTMDRIAWVNACSPYSRQIYTVPLQVVLGQDGTWWHWQRGLRRPSCWGEEESRSSVAAPGGVQRTRSSGHGGGSTCALHTPRPPAEVARIACVRACRKNCFLFVHILWFSFFSTKFSLPQINFMEICIKLVNRFQ